MITPDQKAKRAAYMKQWREKNRERSQEIQHEFADRWKQEHPDDPRTYWQAYREGHPDAVKKWRVSQIAQQKKARERDPEAARETHRAYYRKWSGMPEATLHQRFLEEHPGSIDMDYARPDIYVPGEGFVEIKRALDRKVYGWSHKSSHFPGLFFLYQGTTTSRGRSFQTTVDIQIAKMPRPLTVIVYHAIEGHEICRKVFR